MNNMSNAKMDAFLKFLNDSNSAKRTSFFGKNTVKIKKKDLIKMSEKFKIFRMDKIKKGFSSLREFNKDMNSYVEVSRASDIEKIESSLKENSEKKQEKFDETVRLIHNRSNVADERVKRDIDLLTEINKGDIRVMKRFDFLKNKELKKLKKGYSAVKVKSIQLEFIKKSVKNKFKSVQEQKIDKEIFESFFYKHAVKKEDNDKFFEVIEDEGLKNETYNNLVQNMIKVKYGNELYYFPKDKKDELNELAVAFKQREKYIAKAIENKEEEIKKVVEESIDKDLVNNVIKEDKESLVKESMVIDESKISDKIDYSRFTSVVKKYLDRAQNELDAYINECTNSTGLGKKNYITVDDDKKMEFPADYNSINKLNILRKKKNEVKEIYEAIENVSVSNDPENIKKAIGYYEEYLDILVEYAESYFIKKSQEVKTEDTDVVYILKNGVEFAMHTKDSEEYLERLKQVVEIKNVISDLENKLVESKEDIIDEFNRIEEESKLYEEKREKIRVANVRKAKFKKGLIISATTLLFAAGAVALVHNADDFTSNNANNNLDSNVSVEETYDVSSDNLHDLAMQYKDDLETELQNKEEAKADFINNLSFNYNIGLSDNASIYTNSYDMMSGENKLTPANDSSMSRSIAGIVYDLDGKPVTVFANSVSAEEAIQNCKDNNLKVVGVLTNNPITGAYEGFYSVDDINVQSMEMGGNVR